MNIKQISQNTFGAGFSKDSTTQNLLKEGIETHPYEVYEVHNFLEKVPTKDELSLSSKVSEDGTRYFIQLNDNAKVECNPKVISYNSPIVNVLKQLTYTIAYGGEDFNKIFGEKVYPVGDFSSNAKTIIDKFVDRTDIDDYSKEISKLQDENRNLKFSMRKNVGNTLLLQHLINQNDSKIQDLRKICFAKDKEFVSKALRIK